MTDHIKTKNYKIPQRLLCSFLWWFETHIILKIVIVRRLDTFIAFTGGNTIYKGEKPFKFTQLFRRKLLWTGSFSWEYFVQWDVRAAFHSSTSWSSCNSKLLISRMFVISEPSGMEWYLWRFFLKFPKHHLYYLIQDIYIFHLVCAYWLLSVIPFQ